MQVVHLYGPLWANEIRDDIKFFHHKRNQVFKGMDQKESDQFTSGFFWKENRNKVKTSCPERACLEMLKDVPNKISFEHADQLLQGMTSLSPRTVQKFLEACTSIKVKRLFLWFASRYNYPWFSKLNTESIILGSGNRVIVKGGQLDSNFKITMPKTISL